MKRQHLLQSLQCSSPSGSVCTERSSPNRIIYDGVVIEEKKEQAIPSSLRVCRKCKKSKPLTEENFQPAEGYPDNLHTHCRECRAEYFKDWRAKKDPEYLRRKAMKELYGTTIEWYELKLKEQNDHCALCEATQFTHRKRLAVDHDHSCCPKRGCGKCNRGILCATCNYKLGQLEAVLREAQVVPTLGSWTERAIIYLNQYRRTN